MRNLLISILLIMFLGSCINYTSNWIINKRATPVVILAIDVESNSVIFIDGDNKIFTYTDNSTTKAISASLKIGDTIRFVNDQKFIVKDGKLEYNFSYDSLDNN